MVELLVYGLAIYGFVSLWWHVIQKTSWWYNRRKKELHLLVLLHDSEAYLEWIYRSLEAMSRTTGRTITFTFVDCGSQDDTLRILQLLTKEHQYVQIMDQHQFTVEQASLAKEDDSRTILIDLRTSLI